MKLSRPWYKWVRVSGPFALCVLLGACANKPAHRSFPEAGDLPPQATLPDPLIALDGQRVTSREQWSTQRRPELKALFAHYMYGPIPHVPTGFQAKVLGQYTDFLNGQATLKLITLGPDSGKAPSINLMLVVPNRGENPAPVFLALNFTGNHALTADPRVPLSQSWMYEWSKGCTNHVATEAARGTAAADWPIAEIVRRGYALATFYNGDVDPDRQDVSDGLYACLAGTDPGQNNPTNRGTIAAWAWGFHRCVDYLVKDRDLDPKRIAAVGHSRNGKAALLAAAFDERIAIAYPHQAGCGGSAPSRGKTGESVKAINDRFPHWFNAEFKTFNDTTERLPFDQNCLTALCAPRSVLFSAAEEDQWANPAGQFEVLQATDSVYRFLGVEGFAARQMPPLGQLVDSRLGYYIRPGKHSMTADDWRVFMDFADKQFGRGRHAKGARTFPSASLTGPLRDHAGEAPALVTFKK